MRQGSATGAVAPKGEGVLVADIEDIPVRTSGGEPPPSVVGDRLLLGLAFLALLGGAFIAAGNILSFVAPDTVARTSPTAAASTVAPSRTPRPTPTARPLQELTLLPGEPPDAAFVPDSFPEEMLWVAARTDLPVRGGPSDRSAEIGTLRAGEVGLGSWGDSAPEDGWFQLSEPYPFGWIQVLGVGGSVADVRPVRLGSQEGGAEAIVAGPQGYVARIWAWPRSTWDYDSAIVSSNDGERWQVIDTDLAGGWSTPYVAWGPAGWLAAVTRDDLSDAWIFESGDGDRWAPVGSLRSRGGGGSVERLVGSERGYMMLMARGGYGNAQPELWFSPDAITWQEAASPFRNSKGVGVRSDDERLLATADGFLIWDHSFDEERVPVIAYSANGRGWRHVSLGGEAVAGLQVVEDGEGLLALARDSSGHLVGWRGSIGSGEISFVATDPGDVFEGAVVTATASHEGSAYAFGYDRRDGRERAWASDGATWRALKLPRGGFGAVVRVAAAGPLGLVVGGAQVDERGHSPVFWHLRPNGAWVREPHPVARDPEAADWPECGEPPRTAIEFAALDPGVAIHCFGDASMTFTAWSAQCRDCWAMELDPDRPETWLVDRRRVLFLSPLQDTEQTGWWTEGIPAPDLGWEDAWYDAWIQVSGHYDDPSASSCGAPGPGPHPSWDGGAIEVGRCRRTFVVTAVTVVEGPAATVP